MPPKTLNYRLQQTAGAGRLARNRGSSGPPPLISFPFWRASDRVRVIDESNRTPRNNDHCLARDAAQQRSSDRCQPADHARMVDRASPSFFPYTSRDSWSANARRVIRSPRLIASVYWRKCLSWRLRRMWNHLPGRCLKRCRCPQRQRQMPSISRSQPSTVSSIS